MSKKKVKEAIDYGDYPERMGRSTERAAADPNSLYGNNPAMKGGPQDVERLIGDRFKKVVDHLKRVTNIDDLSSRQVQGMLFNEMMTSFQRIVPIENQHLEALEQLALEASIEETEVDPTWFAFDVSLNRNDIDSSKFRMAPEDDQNDDEEDGEEGDQEDGQEQPQIPSFDIEDLTPEEQLELEKHKRNIINAIIQGAAKKGHYVFMKPEVKAKLDEIDARLYPLYARVMSITDFMYFTMDEMIDQMSQTGQGVIGQNYLTDNSDGDDDGGGDMGGDENGGEENQERPDTKIVAKATMFPVLCHEIIKGIKEASGRHGLPKDPRMAAKVMGQTDLLQNEPMQLRVGPELYQRLRLMLPDEMYSEANKGLIGWFEMVLYQYPAKEFLKIMSLVVSDDESKNRQAEQKFREIMREAQDLKNEYDSYKEDNNLPPDNDDGLEDFLGSLGIKMPD